MSRLVTDIRAVGDHEVDPNPRGTSIDGNRHVEGVEHDDRDRGVSDQQS